MTKITDKIRRIAELSDLCLPTGCCKRQASTLCHCTIQSAIREEIERFDDFNSANDPHGDRDFGALMHNDEKIFWKIDYCAPDLVHGSEDPSDTKQAVRVLTIMLASEY